MIWKTTSSRLFNTKHYAHCVTADKVAVSILNASGNCIVLIYKKPEQAKSNLLILLLFKQIQQLALPLFK